MTDHADTVREAPWKLRLLADWFDARYPDDPTPEVQRDLRSLADALDAQPQRHERELREARAGAKLEGLRAALENLAKLDRNGPALLYRGLYAAAEECDRRLAALGEEGA